MKPTVYSNFNFSFNYEFNDSVSIWIDNFRNLEGDSSKYKIYISMEPFNIINIKDEIMANHNKFDYILTHDTDLLKLDNARLLEFGTKWMLEDEYRDVKMEDKEYSISFVCGRKNMTTGHSILHDIWNSRDRITIPKKFFSSSFQGGLSNTGLVLGDRKTALYDSMFHICVENVKTDYMFTEKLIDTLLMKTIPVYYGCNKLPDYFNTKSIVTFSNLDELVDKANTLTAEYYASCYDSILENYNKALYWMDYNIRLHCLLKKLMAAHV